MPGCSSLGVRAPLLPAWLLPVHGQLHDARIRFSLCIPLRGYLFRFRVQRYQSQVGTIMGVYKMTI